MFDRVLLPASDPGNSGISQYCLNRLKVENDFCLQACQCSGSPGPINSESYITRMFAYIYINSALGRE